jgi:hypothetical protein
MLLALGVEAAGDDLALPVPRRRECHRQGQVAVAPAAGVSPPGPGCRRWVSHGQVLWVRIGTGTVSVVVPSVANSVMVTVELSARPGGRIART